MHHNSLQQKPNPALKACGQFVVILCEGNVYPGQTTSFNEEKIYISAMVESLKSWKCQEKPDILKYEWSDVQGGVNSPKFGSKRIASISDGHSTAPS